MRTVDIIASNNNATDEILSTVAKQAVASNDYQLLMKLAAHPGAGPMTLSIIVSAGNDIEHH